MAGNADEGSPPRPHGKQVIGGGDAAGDDKTDSAPSNSDSEVEFFDAEKGISKFYKGESKSFTDLATEYSVLPVKDLGKPVDTYTRKRKTEGAENLVLEDLGKMSVDSEGGGVSKKLRPAGGGLTTWKNPASRAGCSSETVPVDEGISSGKAGIPSQAPPIPENTASKEGGSSGSTAVEASSSSKAAGVPPQALPTRKKDENGDSDEDGKNKTG